MKQKHTILSVLALFAGAFFFAIASYAESTGDAESAWMTDLEAAKAIAKAENKPMLVDFTGSDWCMWCIRLDEEVFSKQAFKDFAKENLILVEIDFPRKKTQSDELKEKNQALAQKYGIRGFPTILILDAEGKVIERTGYRRGGPEKYVEHLQGILAGL
ncbi:MAG: thioredoxin family protein [Opitutales bacterium]